MILCYVTLYIIILFTAKKITIPLTVNIKYNIMYSTYTVMFFLLIRQSTICLSFSSIAQTQDIDSNTEPFLRSIFLHSEIWNSTTYVQYIHADLMKTEENCFTIKFPHSAVSWAARQSPPYFFQVALNLGWVNDWEVDIIALGKASINI